VERESFFAGNYQLWEYQLEDTTIMKEIAIGEVQGTVLFIDIKNFLGISGILSPKETCQFIMQVIEPLSDSIKEHHGHVCQVQGDAIMAVFTQVEYEGDHALYAIECALEMQKILDLLNPVGISNINVPLSARIGLCSGEMYGCYIRVAGRKEYTVLGKTINLASRYQKINKYYNTKILIDDSVFAYIKNDVTTRKLDKICIEGCDSAVQVYEVLYCRQAQNEDEAKKKIHYEKGLTCYLQGNWDDAIEWFSRVEEDKASYLMIKRCKEKKALARSEQADKQNIK
jgi:class 3 adenylate cyclase